MRVLKYAHLSPFEPLWDFRFKDNFHVFFMDYRVNVVVKEHITELHNSALTISADKLPALMMKAIDKKNLNWM